MASTYVSIDSTGQVAWLTAANFISQCIVDIKYYPFDAQECHMIVSLIVKGNATTTGNKYRQQQQQHKKQQQHRQQQ